MPANPLQIWQCCFKSRSLVQSSTCIQSEASESCIRGGNEKCRQTSRDSDWLSVFLDHPFLVHHLSFTEIKNSDLSGRQTFNLATLVPDAVVNLKNIWQKDPETYIGVLLCADVSGFTHLCEQSSASGRGGTYHITAALNHVFGAMVELIYRSDGDVLKFSGDSLLAAWKVGQDQYLFDVIHQVLSCGLLIQDSLVGYRTEANVSLKVKIAIAAGMLHFSVIGSERARHYVVVGQPVKDIKDAGNRCLSGDVLVAASAWNHCCPRNYDYTTKDGSCIKVNRILYNPSGKRVHMTKVLYSLGRGGENKSLATPSSYVNIATPSYSSESLSQRSSLPMGSASGSSLGSDSSSSSSSESFVSEGSIEIPHSISASISDLTRDHSIRKSPLGTSIHGTMGNNTIRPSVAAASNEMAGAPFRPFMIPPVAQQVDADQPLEYLTEMRHVTTMFVNVVPEEYATDIVLINLVDHVYSTVCRLVYSSLGVVNKVSLFDKDVMMLCVFGLRGFKHQQESQSALRCGATVHRTLRKVHGVRLVSVGITTGTAYCGVVGHPLRREYTVVGSPVNYAARLMVAYPGKVSCEQNTRRLSCLPAHLFRPLPQRTMKGIKQTEDAYQYHEDARKSGPVLMTATGPLLGREDIVAEIEYQLDPRHREYQVIILMGEPRIGKSRLLTVMSKTFTTESDPVVLQLQPVHSAVPFAAAHFIARQILGLSIAERQDRLRQLLPDVSYEDLSTLNKKLGVNFPRFSDESKETTNGTIPPKSRMARREIGLKLIVRMVQAMDPLTVFLLDDVHYADEVSSQIAYDVVRFWQNEPQLKLALGPLIIAAVTVAPLRPPPAINRLMANLSCVHFITLGPLPTDLLPALACQMLNVRSVEFELVRVLEENSRGNPGWCESYLSALLSGNGLRVDMMPLSEMRKKTFCVPKTALLTSCQCTHHFQSTSTMSSVLSCKSGNESQKRSEDDLGESSYTSLEEDNVSEGSQTEMPEEEENNSKNKENSEDYRYLRSFFQGWRTFWKGRPEGLTASHKTSQPSRSDTPIHELCPRAKSRRCSACSLEDENKMQPVCLLASHLDYNQEVAAHLNGAIVASFDSLPPMEQLLLKCGSVLGEVFHRSVLLQLLKGLRPASKRRVNLAIQRLFEMCVLECSISGPDMLSELICRCDVDEKECTRMGVPRYALCRLPRFRSQMVRSAVWDLLPIDQRRALHTRAVRCLYRRRPVCTSCRARARLLSSSNDVTSSGRQSRETGTTLNEEETQVLFSSRQETYSREDRQKEQSYEIKNGIDSLVNSTSGNSVAPKNVSEQTTDSNRTSTGSESNVRRKSSCTNPVRFSVGHMGPTRTCLSGPTKPVLRKAAPVGGEQEASPPCRPLQTSDIAVQVFAQSPPEQSNIQDQTAALLEQPFVTKASSKGTLPPSEFLIKQTLPSVVENLLSNETRFTEERRQLRQEFSPNAPRFYNDENHREDLKNKSWKIKTNRKLSSSLGSISVTITHLKERFRTQQGQESPVSLKRLMCCLPTAPCNRCECPMLLADIYQRLSEHCSAAGLKLHQLRFLTAYGALIMVAGYPEEAIFALAEAIQIAGNTTDKLRSKGDFTKVQNQNRELNDILARINVLIAEAYLQIGDFTAARHFANKEKSRLPWRSLKSSAHAHTVNSDIYSIEGDWARAESEALKALKAAHIATPSFIGTQLLGDTTWALAGAMDAARHCGHPQQCQHLERALNILHRNDFIPISEVPFSGTSNSRDANQQLQGMIAGSAQTPQTSQRSRSVSRASVTDPRQARAAARLLYSIFVSRLYRGRMNDVLEPGEAAFSAAEAMGATFARAAILPHLALAKILLLDISRGNALISYFRTFLEKEASNVDTLRNTSSFKHPPEVRAILNDANGSTKKASVFALLEKDLILFSTAEYHCIRLDATLFVGSALRDAQREAEQFVSLVLGSKSAITPAARRVAARLSLLNARKAKWTECALMTAVASPSFTLLESDANSGVAEIGRSAMFLLEAALYSLANHVGFEKITAMSKMFDKIPQWISELREIVKGAPMLEPRFLLLSAYYKMLRGKTSQALEAVQTAFSIADQQGNRLARTYISLHKAIWQGETSGLSATDWVSAVERSDERTLRPSIMSAALLESIPSSESVETRPLSRVQSTSDPLPPASATPSLPTILPTATAECTAESRPTRSFRLSAPRLAADGRLSHSTTDDFAMRRFRV